MTDAPKVESTKYKGLHDNPRDFHLTPLLIQWYINNEKIVYKVIIQILYW